MIKYFIQWVDDRGEIWEGIVWVAVISGSLFIQAIASLWGYYVLELSTL